jgi:hypothetical protein
MILNLPTSNKRYGLISQIERRVPMPSMHYTPVKILFARYIRKCRFVKVAARMNQNVAAIPEGLSTGAVLDFNFPFSVRLVPGRLVDTMRKADMMV